MKRIHGEPIPLWEKLGLQQFPPVECSFAVGDRVIYTNECGMKFDMDIIGFSNEVCFFGFFKDRNSSKITSGRFIHLKRHGKSEDGSCWWFPYSPQELTMYNQSVYNK